MRRVISCVGGLLLLFATSAAAQEADGSVGTSSGRGGQGWSVLSGQTVGRDSLVFQAEFGVPGLELGLLYGATDKLDLGGRFSFNYLYEGIVNTSLPGISLNAVIRLKLLDRPKFNLGLSVEPGPYFYFVSNFGTAVGFALPVALTLGIPVGSALMINAGLDIPFHVLFGAGGGPFVPVLVGAGVEYFIDRSLAVTFNTRMGPQLTPYNTVYGRYYYGRNAPFTMEALFGVAIKL